VSACSFAWLLQAKDFLGNEVFILRLFVRDEFDEVKGVKADGGVRNDFWVVVIAFGLIKELKAWVEVAILNS
jgi:hypothetical protein